MMRLLYSVLMLFFLSGLTLGTLPTKADADFVVYSVYKGLYMGGKHIPEKDFYINMGKAHGLKAGAKLEVLRKIATYDLINKKLQQDVTFPIARLKVIHVESTAAIARLDKMLPLKNTPVISPNAVIVGDIVRRTK